MEIRPVVIRQELMQSLTAINAQIEEVKKEAATMGIEPYQMRDHNGSWVFILLLAARVQALHALALLNQKG